ncbi:MAG: TIGR00725 family protein [Candidatus Schekmanbacteria bacterium RBG_16_38_11]|uniref:TIGR00725 family protein n=1 Tax=Candidatus Schekmanbacteria bacterium RBG_16_38_11 TaxID=1817880 RepID=A0A1F7RUY0_9BACT|nr:MAG: TIGR00725 family protein [Candidatus Schekmanbacteria bacterium RBG_16_38_11]
MSLQIGVIGAGECSAKDYKIAYEVGREIANAGAVLVCGGLVGIMEGACKGAKENKGVTVGILPGDSKKDANPYVDISIVTSLSHARNNLVVRSSDVIIAIKGGYGTLSEIAIALKIGKKVIGIDTWDVSEEIIQATDAKDAVRKVLAVAKKKGL